MFQNIIIFIEQSLQNILDLIKSLISAGDRLPADLITELLTLFQHSVVTIISLLESIIPTVSPVVAAEIQAAIYLLQNSLTPISRVLWDLLASTTQSVQQVTTALEQFFTNFFRDLSDLLDSIFNPSSPEF